MDNKKTYGIPYKSKINTGDKNEHSHIPDRGRSDWLDSN